MRHRDAGRGCLRILVVCFLLSLLAVPAARAGEWEDMRDSYDSKLRAHAKRIAELEARERGVPADEEKRADKITRDRITGIRASLQGGGKAKSLADTVERAPGDARVLVDVHREQREFLDIVKHEWGAEGAERRKLREALAISEKNLDRSNADLALATEVAEAMRLQQADALEKVARIEAETAAAGDRLKARWQREQAAREREREQREREAAERARGVR
jgi:hypothetical protein